RHRRAKKNTVAIPVSRNAHHCQLLATPPVRTRSVTRLGVSVLNVVATIDTPISHHGAARPLVKNSAALCPARRAIQSAGTKQMRIEAITIPQSSMLGLTEPPWQRRAASHRG